MHTQSSWGFQRQKFRTFVYKYDTNKYPLIWNFKQKFIIIDIYSLLFQGKSRQINCKYIIGWKVTEKLIGVILCFKSLIIASISWIRSYRFSHKNVNFNSLVTTVR